MRTDEVYRFLVLRDPGTRSGDRDERDGRDARLVPAYAEGEESKSSFARTIGPLLESGDVGSARAAASAFLGALPADERSAWRKALRAGASFAAALKRHALADDNSRALKAIGDLGALASKRR